MALRSGVKVGRAPQILGLVAGLAALWVGTAACAQSAAQPAARVPWEQIGTGLARLADGDGGAAEADFRRARKTDESGLAELLTQLTEAYVVYNPQSGPEAPARSLKANERLDAANRHFYRRQIPPAVLADALTRIRTLLKQAPARESSPPLLRPLLCNLRLLSRDHATDGEPVLEVTGKSRDVGSLSFPQPVFAPNPPYTEAARESRTGGTVVVELILDSEGCPVSETLLKPLSKGLADQTLATLRWWAFQPARYEKTAVGIKITMTVRFAIA